jgi:hypothetical protein
MYLYFAENNSETLSIGYYQYFLLPDMPGISSFLVCFCIIEQIEIGFCEPGSVLSIPGTNMNTTPQAFLDGVCYEWVFSLTISQHWKVYP